VFQSTQSPLAPHVLAFAGVPIEDALWLERLKSIPGAHLRALLHTQRGASVLQTVRNYQQRHQANDAFPLKRRA